MIRSRVDYRQCNSDQEPPRALNKLWMLVTTPTQLDSLADYSLPHHMSHNKRCNICAAPSNPDTKSKHCPYSGSNHPPTEQKVQKTQVLLDAFLRKDRQEPGALRRTTTAFFFG